MRLQSAQCWRQRLSSRAPLPATPLRAATPPTPLTYRDAGVDIDAGNALVERIKPLVARTRRAGVLGGLGGFGGLFELGGRYREPVLVSGTDGVGTKIKLAQQLHRHDTIGIDLVGMCVNDVLVQGAEPLFFLDYFATGKLDVEVAAAVIAGIARGCEESGCALLGGETAEMPDMYPPGEYDLAGFCVGAVEKSELLDGSAVKAGDVLIGVASSGAHANGFSLIRKILDRSENALDTRLGDIALVDALLAPTRLYVKPMLALLRDCAVHGFSHITGGGLVENIIRVVPDGLGLDIDAHAWPQTALFDWIAREGAVPPSEMWRTFNCGIGFVVICSDSDASSIATHLTQSGLEHWPIGRVVHASGDRVRIG